MTLLTSLSSSQDAIMPCLAYSSTVDTHSPAAKHFQQPRPFLKPASRYYNAPQADQLAGNWNNGPPILTNFAYHSGAENSLRRKTPNGTIDNGYDGSPTQHACGPPAPKYLNMTPVENMFMDSARHNQHAPWCYPQSPRDGCEDSPSVMTPIGGGFNQRSMGYSPSYGPSLPSPSANAHPMNMGLAMHNGFANTYQTQPLPSHSHHSPAVYTSVNPPWVDNPLVGYQSNVQISYPPHNFPHDTGFLPAQAPLPPWPSYAPGYGQSSPFPRGLDDGCRNFAAMPQPSQQLQALSLGSGPFTAGNGMIQPPEEGRSFKEGVLLDSHKAYTDLVAQVSRSKRASHGKSSSRPMKNLIFPKGPNSIVTRPSSQLQRAHHSFPGAIAPYSPHQLVPTLNSANMVSKLARNSGMLPSPQLDVTGRALGGYSILPGAVYGNALVQVDHRESARNWLAMLDAICSNYDWKWLDGMLMGGCLLHSLERYEEALEWFGRIIILDSK